MKLDLGSEWHKNFQHLIRINILFKCIIINMIFTYLYLLHQNVTMQIILFKLSFHVNYDLKIKKLSSDINSRATLLIYFGNTITQCFIRYTCIYHRYSIIAILFHWYNFFLSNIVEQKKTKLLTSRYFIHDEITTYQQYKVTSKKLTW